MKLKICDMKAETDKVAKKKNTLIYLTFQLRLMKKRIVNYFKGLDLSIYMMKMEILIHELLHIFEKQMLMLKGFYLKKFIMKILANTRET